MGLFKGKRKSGLTLSLRKNYAQFNFTRSYYQREHNQLDTDNLHRAVTSTLRKLKRKRIIVSKLGAVKSPLYKRLRIISPLMSILSFFFL